MTCPKCGDVFPAIAAQLHQCSNALPTPQSQFLSLQRSSAERIAELESQLATLTAQHAEEIARITKERDAANTLIKRWADHARPMGRPLWMAESWLLREVNDALRNYASALADDAPGSRG